MLQGLREMLEISHRNGSYSDPLIGPKMVTRGCQTEPSNASSSTATTSSTLSSSTPINNDKSSTSSKTSVGFSSGGRPLDDSNGGGGRPLSSLNGNSTTSCENLRPLSSASEESEETSSISDDDEIIFNTIKRQAKKTATIFSGKDFVANNNGSAADDNLNDDGCDAEVAVNVAKTESTKNVETTDAVGVNDDEVEGLVKVNGDSHNLADCIVEQHQEVLSQS